MNASLPGEPQAKPGLRRPCRSHRMTRRERPDEPRNVMAALPVWGYDMVLDASRRRYYVSLPEYGMVYAFSTESFTLVEQFIVGSEPRGMALSIDHSRLFVALHGSGAVAVVDLDSGGITELDLLEDLGDEATFDVIEAQPGRLFVSADARGSGSSHIVQVWLDRDNTVERVNDIDWGPVFEVGPDRDFLYVTFGQGTSSFLKLDLREEEAPIIQEDPHNPLGSSRNFAVSPDGSQLFLRSGQILNTASLAQVGSLGSGVPQFGEHGYIVYTASQPDQLVVYETDTHTAVAQLTLPCEFNSIRKLIIMPEDAGWLVLGDDRVCGRIGGPLCSQPPGQLFDERPANAAGDVPIETVLSWSSDDVDCATSFNVYLGSNDPPTRVVCDCSSQSLCVPETLDAGTTYYWQVEAMTEAGITRGPVWTFDTQPCDPPMLPQDDIIDLPGPGRDLLFDAARNMAYVSIPELDSIVFVSLDALEVVDVLTVGMRPFGMDLALDGTRLFAALHFASGVAIVDLDARTVSQIDIGHELGDSRTHDVVEGLPDKLFVTASPVSNGSSWVVQVHLDEDNYAQRVASHQFIRNRPVLARSPDPSMLFVAEKSAINPLRKLDLTQPDAPVELMADHSPIWLMRVSPDAQRLYLRNGTVLSAQTLDHIHSIPAGVMAFGVDPDIVYVSSDADHIRVQSSNGAFIDELEVPCGFNGNALEVLPADRGFLMLGTEQLCYYGVPDAPSAAINPGPPDSALDLPLDTALTWVSGDGGCIYTEYTVRLDTVDPPRQVQCAGSADTHCTATQLDPDTTYYWQVIAANRGGESLTPVWSFTTAGE